jgi:Flp pilus assembly pilin Flp
LRSTFHSRATVIFWRLFCFAIKATGLPIHVKGGNALHLINKTVVRASEWYRGQTMTEYALILSAVAVVVYLGYQTMGGTITSLLGTVDTSL